MRSSLFSILGVFLLSSTGAALAQRQELRDVFGDPLPPGVLARMGSVRLQLPAYVTHVAYSPDGTMIASASDDGTVILFHLDSKKEHRFRPVGSGSSVAFSRDSKLLAVGGGGVYIYETSSGKEKLSLPRAHAASPCRVAFLSGETLASVGADTFIRVWRLADGKKIGEIPFEGLNPRSLAALPDGQRVILGGAPYDGVRTGTFRMLDASSGKEVWRAKYGERVEAAILSADGKTIATSDAFGTGGCRVWDAADGKELARFKAVGSALAFSPDGRTIALAGDYRTIHLCDVASGKVNRKLAVWSASSACLAFSPDGKTLLAGSSDAHINLWDVSTGKLLDPLPGHTRFIQDVVFSSDGRTLASRGMDDTIRVWDAATGKEQWRFAPPAEPEFAKGFQFEHAGTIAFSPNGKQLAGVGAGRRVHLWDPAAGKEVGVLAGHDNYISSLRHSIDGKCLYTGSYDGTIREWSLASMKTQRTLPMPQGAVTAMAMTDDGQRLAVATWRENQALGEASFHLWDLPAGKMVRPINTPQPNNMIGMQFLSKGRLLATLGDNMGIHVANLAADDAIERIKLQKGRPGALAVSPDGRLLAVGVYDGGAYLVEAHTWEIVRCLRGHRWPVGAVAFSADGTRLASGSNDASVLIWDLQPAAWLTDSAPQDLTPGVMDAAWKLLSERAGEPAYQAMTRLRLVPRRTVSYLTAMLKPAPVVSDRMIARMIADLDSDKFQERESAAKELALLKGEVEELLYKTLRQDLPAETRRRIEAILEQWRQERVPPEDLRQMRAVQLLEKTGSPEALELLANLAKGSPRARQTREATDSLERLRKQGSR